MKDKINGIIICGSVFVNTEKTGSCTECELYEDCVFKWNHYGYNDCDIYGGDAPRPFKFSQELTDKLNH